MAAFIFHDYDSLGPYMPFMWSPRSHRSCHRQQRNQDISSNVQCNKELFQVNLEVQQFAPKEIQVKVVDNSIVVEAKHEEKPDEHGFISRKFVRKYVVPEEHDIQNIASTLSSDGVLTIKVPKTKPVEAKERVIPISLTGPQKAIKESVQDDDKKEEN